MEKANVQDLQLKIENQKKIIYKYEVKLRDVVSAYKSLQKEKNVLEETVKSLNFSCPVENSSKSDRKETNTEFVDPLLVNANLSAGNEIQWKEKLSSVTKALATISDEKSKMEVNFQMDKKKINQQRDELKQQIEEMKKQFKTKENQLSNDIEKYKQRLRSLQLEREKEQNDHQIMLRELQEIVSSERLQKEQLESQLEDAQMMIAIKESQPDKSKQHEKKIKNLTEEMKSIKSKLKIAEETATKPSSMELKLQYEMAKAEGEHTLAIFQEQQRSKEVETRLKEEMKMSAEQINGLETRLADLSETIGEYDRQKQQDLTTIRKLKEKISQLEMENSSLAKAVNCVGEKEIDESSFDVQELKAKISKLMGMLKSTEYQSDFDDSNKWLHIDHIHCQTKFQQLKDEFEFYKRRTQSMTKKTKENESFKEEEILREQVSDLKEKVNNLSSDFEESDKKHRITINSLRSTLDEAEFNQKQNIQSIKSEWQSKLSSVEQQLQRQRERSFALLEEKENEIEVLKVQLGIGHRKASKQSNHEQDLSLEEKSTYYTDSNVNLLGVAVELCKLTASDKKEAQFLHYAQELARKDVEITNLRKAKHQLETMMRDIEIKNSATEENLVKQLEDANEQILRLTRNCSREGANLEYLKNVVLSYMLSSSATSRQHMLNAIATVLKFSSKELESVKAYNSAWW